MVGGGEYIDIDVDVLFCEYLLFALLRLQISHFLQEKSCLSFAQPALVTLTCTAKHNLGGFFFFHLVSVADTHSLILLFSPWVKLV